jgi:anhydro-N-acetylmuramic acid kinase
VPLSVPIGDRILFAEYDYCMNEFGWFSNVSFEEKENRIAFDISPVNTVLNFYSNQLDSIMMIGKFQQPV